MAAESGEPRPVSGREMYQYAAAALRRNLFSPVERIAAAFRDTGRAFSESRFRSMAALARYNVTRSLAADFPTDTQALPNTFYRETLSFGSAAYRMTALVEVRDTASGQRREVSFTLASDASLSPEAWLAQANEALGAYRSRYGYDVLGINLVDPRRRTVRSLL